MKNIGKTVSINIVGDAYTKVVLKFNDWITSAPVGFDPITSAVLMCNATIAENDNRKLTGQKRHDDLKTFT